MASGRWRRPGGASARRSPRQVEDGKTDAPKVHENRRRRGGSLFPPRLFPRGHGAENPGEPRALGSLDPRGEHRPQADRRIPHRLHHHDRQQASTHRSRRTGTRGRRGRRRPCSLGASHGPLACDIPPSPRSGEAFSGPDAYCLFDRRSTGSSRRVLRRSATATCGAAGYPPNRSGRPLDHGVLSPRLNAPFPCSSPRKSLATHYARGFPRRGWGRPASRTLALCFQ